MYHITLESVLFIIASLTINFSLFGEGKKTKEMKTKLGRCAIGRYNSLINILKFQDNMNLGLICKKTQKIYI